jgi:2-C-methyl-D-erythritol 4-phosphate cytidylyltransferase
LVPVSVLEVELIAVGPVLDEGRGSLPFALVHGEALVAAATWALSEAGVLPVDARTGRRPADADAPARPARLLCPMTPPEFIGRAYAARSTRRRGRRRAPVTDTVKTSATRRSAQTVDREAWSAWSRRWSCRSAGGAEAGLSRTPGLTW